MSWLSNEELARFRHVGRGVRVSRDAMILGAENVHIGDNVRIDAGVKILATKGHLDIGSHVHVACNAIFVCGGGISVGDFVPISFGCQLISASDSYRGDALVGPMFDRDLMNVTAKPIVLDRLSGLGASCVVLPGVTMAEGSVAGACALVCSSTLPWQIYVGQPARATRARAIAAKDMALEWERRWSKGMGT
jgi:galactoside O-acetyltransferase